MILKYNQGIIKPKQGYQYFIKPKAGNKYYKLFMGFSNINPIKCSNNIKFSIKVSTVQGIKYFINKREQVLVFNSNVIKSYIVIADPYPFFQFSSK